MDEHLAPSVPQLSEMGTEDNASADPVREKNGEGSRLGRGEHSSVGSLRYVVAGAVGCEPP